MYQNKSLIKLTFSNPFVVIKSQWDLSLVLIPYKNYRYWLKTKRLREGCLLILKVALFLAYNQQFLRPMRTGFKRTSNQLKLLR